MKQPGNSREGASKRRLHFGRHHAMEMNCCGAESPASLGDASPEAASPCQRSVGHGASFGEHLVRSPTHDGGIRLARAEVTTGCFGQLLDSSSAAVANSGLQRPNMQLFAALSSSRCSLEQICSVSGSAQAFWSPPAAAEAALPLAPRKRRTEAAELKASGRLTKERSRAARALQGMAPASLSELQSVRAWLTLLEAQQ